MKLNELVDETAVDTGDPVLTTDEVEQYSSKVLRRMAAASESDAISGRDVRLEWVAFFCRQRTLADYAED